MEKTEARKRLDTYIDVCSDCYRAVTPEKSCHTCAVLPKVIATVREIRAERRNKK